MKKKKGFGECTTVKNGRRGRWSINAEKGGNDNEEGDDGDKEGLV
jgi:hypothetical protein